VGEMMKEEGMEVISQSSRYLNNDDAFFLRSRVLNTKEENLMTAMSGHFKGKISAEADIRKSCG
jgi:hypothetical protein